MAEPGERAPDPAFEEVLLSKDEGLEEELLLINPGNKRRRLRPSNKDVVRWAQAVYESWASTPSEPRSTFIREVEDTLVPKWKVSFHPERGGVALASRTIRTKTAQLRVFWKFWIYENCLFYTALDGFQESAMREDSKLQLFDRYSRMRAVDFRMKDGFAQLRIDELPFTDLLLLSMRPDAPEVSKMQVQTAKALVPFPPSLLDFLKRKQVVVCLGHFVKKSVVVYRMSPAYIALILNTLRANVLVFYRWQLGSKAQLQRVLVALENLTRQLGAYGRIERRRFGAANTSLSWLDFQLMRHVFARKLAVFLFTRFGPSDFTDNEKMRAVFIKGHPRSVPDKNKESNAYRYMQLATGISQLMLLGCLSGPTLRPSMLPKIGRNNLKFRPVERDGPDARWVYYYDDSYVPTNFNKVSKVQTDFTFPLPHFLFPITEAEAWVTKKGEDWKKWQELSNKLLEHSWYEDEDLACFSLFNLALTLFFQTPLGALAHAAAAANSTDLKSEDNAVFSDENLQKVGWAPGADPDEQEVLMLLPNLKREFDVDKTIARSRGGRSQITENLQGEVLKLLYQTNSCVFVNGGPESVSGGFGTWKKKDMTVQKCRHLFETANSLIASNLDSLGVDEIMGEDQKKRQAEVFRAGARMSLHSVRTAESVYVSNAPMVEESLKIVDMLDRLVAQNIFSQDMNKAKPSKLELSTSNRVLYYFRHPSFTDRLDEEDESALHSMLVAEEEDNLQAGMKEGVDFAEQLQKLNDDKDRVGLTDWLRVAAASKNDKKKNIPRAPTGSSLYLTVSKTLRNLFLAVGVSKEDNKKKCEKCFWSFEMMRIKPEEWKDIVKSAEGLSTSSVDENMEPGSGDDSTDTGEDSSHDDPF